MQDDAGKPGWQEERQRRGGPVAVAGLIGAVTQPLMRGRQAAVARLSLDWPQVVGPALAAVTAPERLSGAAGGGTLTIRASGPMALELAHLAPELIARINAHLGREAVARLKFSADGRRARPSALAPPPPPPRPPPREAARAAATVVADLPDGPLKDALARLGAHVLARR
ncbi:MAG: DciA family protein [Acetobacteraceae bacterium]|nr:DciA family protein [Acetobacteraceae bacterium]